MAEVISFAAIRRAQQVAPIQSLPLDKLLVAILRVATPKVSLQATVLLQLIAMYLNEGEVELSYTFLMEGMRASRASVIKYVEELEDAGFLKVRRSRINRTTNAVNQFEINFNSELGVDMPKLKIPRRLNEKGSIKSIPPPKGVVQNVDAYLVNNNIIDVTNSRLLIPKGIGRSAPPVFDTISEALDFSVKRVTRVRTAKAASVTTSRLTMASTKAAWAAAMLKHHPSVPAIHLTLKEFAIFKNRVQPILATSSLTEFFEYVVSSWTALRASKFEWLRRSGKDVAPAPSISELMRYWKIFAQAFADSRMRQAQQEITEADKSAIDFKHSRAEAARLREELARAHAKMEHLERMVSVPIERKPRSLTELQREANKRYDDGSGDIPEWK